ncbi:aldehyde dehydrogenase family protein, partial [Bhargavaea beijingensis]
MIPYKHEPLTDFSNEENRRAYEQGFSIVKEYLGQEIPLVIGGERIYTEDKMENFNPSNREEIIGYVSKATQEHAEKAMQVAQETFETWRKVKPEVRADILFRAAAIARRRKFELSALLSKEAGKPWPEADADVAEGIDFLEYYGRQMIAMKDGVPVAQRPGEDNRFSYIPLGVGVVISPWNFAFAIMAGTAVAAAVTGNTVLLKP